MRFNMKSLRFLLVLLPFISCWATFKYIEWSYTPTMNSKQELKGTHVFVSRNELNPNNTFISVTNSLREYKIFKDQLDKQSATLGILVLAETIKGFNKDFNESLSSILNTMESNYNYTIYVSVNQNTPNSEIQALKSASHVIKAVTTHSELFMDKFNELAILAYSEGVDYIVTVNKSVVFKSGNWTSAAMHALTTFNPTNIGVVSPKLVGDHFCFTAHFVHRTHLTIFENFYRSNINASHLHDWITNVYSPHRNSTLKSWVVESKTPRCMDKDEKRFTVKLKDKHRVVKYIAKCHNTGKLVISYSLFGADSRYSTGAVHNIKLAPNVFPGWTLRIYYDDTVPLNVTKQLNSLNNNNGVELVNMSNMQIRDKRTWRFLVASDVDVDRYVIRNIDSALTQRDKAAVDEWIISGKRFHVMRDHPNHTRHALCGGLWGGVRDALSDMDQRLFIHTNNHIFELDEDMNFFLNYELWLIVKKSVLQHDSFSCGKFGFAHPFPTKRIFLEYVGKSFTDIHSNTSSTIIKKAIHNTSFNCSDITKRRIDSRHLHRNVSKAAKNEHRPKPVVWISLGVCLSTTIKEFNKNNFPYKDAAFLASLLWLKLPFGRKVRIHMHVSYTKDDKTALDLISKLKVIGVVVVPMVTSMEHCVMMSQTSRLYAYRHHLIQENDIIITADVDAFPTTPIILDPLKFHRPVNIWQHNYTEHSGDTFPMSFISMSKYLWRHVMDCDDEIMECVAPYKNHIVDPDNIADPWGTDQYMITHKLLVHKKCSLNNEMSWWRMKLPYAPFDDFTMCGHFSLKNRHYLSNGHVWTHFFPRDTPRTVHQRYRDILKWNHLI